MIDIELKGERFNATLKIVLKLIRMNRIRCTGGTFLKFNFLNIYSVTDIELFFSFLKLCNKLFLYQYYRNSSTLVSRNLV